MSTVWVWIPANNRHALFAEVMLFKDEEAVSRTIHKSWHRVRHLREITRTTTDKGYRGFGITINGQIQGRFIEVPVTEEAIKL